MPINAGPEYFKAEERYLSAKTREEKIAALEEMIRKLPKHKGTQTLLGQLKKRLAKLKKESSVRAKAKPKFIIRKEGSAQVCIVGLTNSGKSSLINALTNAKANVGDYPYTTKEIEYSFRFLIKLWNACRFSSPNLIDFEYNRIKQKGLKLTPVDTWILYEFNKVIESSKEDLEVYNFHNALTSFRQFFWRDF